MAQKGSCVPMLEETLEEGRNLRRGNHTSFLKLKLNLGRPTSKMYERVKEKYKSILQRVRRHFFLNALRREGTKNGKGI